MPRRDLFCLLSQSPCIGLYILPLQRSLVVSLYPLAIHLRWGARYRRSFFLTRQALCSLLVLLFHKNGPSSVRLPLRPAGDDGLMFPDARYAVDLLSLGPIVPTFFLAS